MREREGEVMVDKKTQVDEKGQIGQTGEKGRMDQKGQTGGNPRSVDHTHKDTSGWLKTLLSYVSRCRGRMIVAEAASVISVFSGLVPFYAVYRIIDLVVVSVVGTFAWDAVFGWAALAGIGYLAKQLLFAVSTMNSHIAAYTILAGLRDDIAERLMGASLGTAQATSVGELKDVIVDRIEQIEVPLAHMVPELSANMLLAVAIAVWLVLIDWRLALAAVAIVPITLLVMALGMQSYYKMYGGYMAEQDHVNSVVVEYIEGIRVVKAFNQATSSYEKFAQAVRGFCDYTVAWMRRSRVSMGLALSLLPTTLLGVAPMGIALYLGGSLTVAQFALACVLAMAIVIPVTYLGTSFNEMNLMSYVIADAQAFLKLPELSQPTEAAVVHGYGVRLSHVRFSYDGKTEVLHDISFDAPAGTFTALVGPSGSGKSTMARLIARHWDVGEGGVSIGGTDVRDMPLFQLSSLVSYVSQDDFLLDGTLRENVALGKPGASDDEVGAAAAAASCDEFVNRLPYGWDTPAGEAGHALSGGERQRICIARAILKDAPVVVFDEATAFADPENEAHIQRSVARLAEGKTLIVIAHRLSTIVSADNICVVDDGRIVAQGTHEELLERCPLYARMWSAHIGAGTWAAGSHGESSGGSPEELYGRSHGESHGESQREGDVR